MDRCHNAQPQQMANPVGILLTFVAKRFAVFQDWVMEMPVQPR